jgi:rod shape-determining protein MreC
MRRRILDYSIAAALVVCALLLFFANARGAERSGFDRAILRIAAPLEAAAGWVIGGVGDVFHRYIWLRDVDGENRELRAVNEELRRENADLRQRQVDLDELADLLGMRERLRARGVGARVVAGSLSPHFRLLRVSVDRGEGEIAAGAPVVTGAGLVGRVEAVYAGYSEVLLITDPRSSVDVALPRSGGRGVLTGEGRSDRYVARLEQLDRDAAARVGDPVVTSGLGGAFPAGIAVGKITAVRSDPSSLYQEVEVEPAVDFTRFESVLILLTVAPPPTDDPAPERVPMARRVRPL